MVGSAPSSQERIASHNGLEKGRAKESVKRGSLVEIVLNGRYEIKSQGLLENSEMKLLAKMFCEFLAGSRTCGNLWASSWQSLKGLFSSMEAPKS